MPRDLMRGVVAGAALEVAYNQWTQFEEWPQFMQRVMQVTQEDDCTVSFKVKVWGMSKEFVAEIVEQRPDERIRWNASEGVTHSGVVTFHELAPRLTRIQVSARPRRNGGGRARSRSNGQHARHRSSRPARRGRAGQSSGS